MSQTQVEGTLHNGVYFERKNESRTTVKQKIDQTIKSTELHPYTLKISSRRRLVSARHFPSEIEEENILFVRSHNEEEGNMEYIAYDKEKKEDS